jgi:hypothetical protein
MSATSSPWGAELALGDRSGSIDIVEPTGPFVDDPDLTDKRFPGNPTKTDRSREPLRVVGEVTDWRGHSPEEIKAMTDARDRRLAAQAALVARIPGEGDLDRTRTRADRLAREWAADAPYVGCTLLMLIKAADVEVFSAISARGAHRHRERGDLGLRDGPFRAGSPRRPATRRRPRGRRVNPRCA